MGKPTMTMLVGIPASGKSTWANEQRLSTDVVIHSSDALRKELFGDVNDQSHNGELFQELHRRIKSDLKSGKDVIYDATNLNAKRRRAFLDELKDIDCKNVAVVFATPYATCLRQNWMRERKVPDEVMRKMYMNWQTPWYFEGWDEITVKLHIDCYKSHARLIANVYDYDQNNPWHKLTLGKHMIKCNQYVIDHQKKKNLALSDAAFYHDCGKPFCRFDDENGVSHYFNHENVGAYDALTLYGLSLKASAYITYHMYPMHWKNISTDKQKLYEKYKSLWGEEFFNDIMFLHKADKEAGE